MKNITSKKELDELLVQSHESPQVVFKHSLVCPVSRGAYDRLKSLLEESYFHLLIVQESAALKMIVADLLDVEHQSPQVIIIANGEAVYHASHHSITKEDTLKALDEYQK